MKPKARKLKVEKDFLETKKKFNKKLISILIGLGSSVSSYVVFGAVTSIIKNPFFTRMTPVRFLEYFSLISTSLLLGAYFGLSYYIKANNRVCNASAATGGVFGFLTFGCSICNKLLVFFLGIAGVLTYFDPIRPFLGIASLGFLGFAVFVKARSISSSRLSNSPK